MKLPATALTAAIVCLCLSGRAQAATLASYSASAFAGVSFTSAVYEGTSANAMGDLTFRYWYDEGDYGAYPQDGAKVSGWRPKTGEWLFDATESFRIVGETDTPLRSPSGYAATYLLPGLFYWRDAGADAPRITVTYEVYSATEAYASVEGQTGASSATASAGIRVTSGIVDQFDRFVGDTQHVDGISAFASSSPAVGQSKSVVDVAQSIFTRSLTIAPGQGVGLDLYVTDVSGASRILPEPEIAVIPLPAGLPMLAAALGLLGLVRRDPRAS